MVSTDLLQTFHDVNCYLFPKEQVNNSDNLYKKYASESLQRVFKLVKLGLWLHKNKPQIP